VARRVPVALWKQCCLGWRGHECTFIDMSEMLPLFPLSTVLFPGMRLPLHVF